MYLYLFITKIFIWWVTRFLKFNFSYLNRINKFRFIKSYGFKKMYIF